MDIKNLDYKRYKQLNWFVYVQRLNEEKPPKNFGMVSTKNKKKRRPRNLWMQEVIARMREKGIKNKEWVYREEWRSKIK